MLVNVVSFLKGTIVGSQELNNEIFNIEVRPDIIKRVVRWQLLNRMAGTKARKNLSEVSGTGKKPFAQKGTGRARLGTLRAPHLRGGAAAQPVSRVHTTKLQKKVRILGLKSILSSKMSDGKLIVVDHCKIDAIGTKILSNILNGRGIKSCYMISDAIDDNLLKSCSNLHTINVVPFIGANVYDILKHEYLIIDVQGMKMLEERLI